MSIADFARGPGRGIHLAVDGQARGWPIARGKRQARHERPGRAPEDRYGPMEGLTIGQAIIRVDADDGAVEGVERSRPPDGK